MQRTTIDFGIDLGTTNSTIAVIDNVDAKVIPNKGGSGTTPSAVWIDKRGSVHVGQEAKLRALVGDPANADLEFKLRMGLGGEGAKTFSRSGRTLTPEELSAEVLKSLRTDVQSNMGEQMRAAVITVPAAFENPSTNATRKAAELAGFMSSPLLLEPVAASLAYGFQTKADNVYWFVYDFGGGTFDAAVMRIRDGLIQVVNHDGDNFLGGKLIDWDIVTKKLIPALTAEFNLPDFRRGNPRWEDQMGKLKYHAELAKIEVCRSKDTHELWIEGLCVDEDGKEVDFAYTLTPEDVEEISKPYIERSLSLCRNTLKRAGLEGPSMERILMVGGTTLNPWVRDAVQRELGAQVEFGIDPVTVVARGAAIFASTQALPRDESVEVSAGTWRVETEHEPVGNVNDPDIGGRVFAPDGESAEGCSIEFVDSKTQWRSGRVTLDATGVFMTQLYAQDGARHVYQIELFSASGAPLDTDPGHVTYTFGVIPEKNPPAAMTIGVGMANGLVAPYVQKGAKLPLRKSMDHITTSPLRAGNEEDVLRIPLTEGEHRRADRNHLIGYMEIRGTDIRRDLPSGSDVEITLILDASQQIRIQVFIPSLDEDFEKGFDPQMKHNSLDELRKELEEQKTRLSTARDKAEGANASRGDAAMAAITDQRLLEHVDDLSEAAEGDPEAIAQFDRRIRELAAAVDQFEDAIEWPLLLDAAETARAECQEVVERWGESGDQRRYSSLEADLRQAVEAGDPELLRRSRGDLDVLWYQVMHRQDGYHVSVFERLTERTGSMRDPGQADQIVAQGRRAINNNDIDALKAANRQLQSLLPQNQQDDDGILRPSDVMVRG